MCFRRGELSKYLTTLLEPQNSLRIFVKHAARSAVGFPPAQQNRQAAEMISEEAASQRAEPAPARGSA